MKQQELLALGWRGWVEAWPLPWAEPFLMELDGKGVAIPNLQPAAEWFRWALVGALSYH